MALENMAAQFKGLPMGDLIGGPLNAACDAQVRLAQATVDFIRVVGFKPPDEPESDSKGDKKNIPKSDPWSGDTRTAKFSFDRPVMLDHGTPATTENGVVVTQAKPPVIGSERVELEVPVLAIVKIPSLSITTVDITFDMEVKSSESSKESSDANASLDAEMKFGWGLFSGTVRVHGSVATHKENTRSSDNSAKYHVEVHAQDSGMPEGLARVLDILAQSVAPKAVTPKQIPATH
jgi:hypothetical protein